jgi:hypothetical protein
MEGGMNVKKVAIFIFLIFLIVNNSDQEKRHPIVFFEPSQITPIQNKIILDKQFKKTDYFWVRGFSDPTGDRNKNIALSKQRAEEVKKRLVQNYGIKESQIVATFHGVDMTENVDNSQKRRVEIYSGSRHQIARLAEREIKNYNKSDTSVHDQKRLSSTEDSKKAGARRPSSRLNSL